MIKPFPTIKEDTYKSPEIEKLFDIGKEFGVEKELKKFKYKGEDPEEIYSGGVISDIFDTLNALQYGVTGLIKGKSFKEGVKTRQSFSDKDALGDFGLPGTIAGIALDIAVDPLTYIPVFGLGVKALKGIKKGLKITGKTAAKVPALKKTGDVIGRSLVYRYGQDKVYRQLAERSIRNIAVAQQNIMDIVKPLLNLDSSTQKIITKARKAGKLKDLPSDILAKAKPVFDDLDRLSREAIDVLPLSKAMKAKYNENIGTYIKRAYTEIRKPGKLPFAKVKPKRIPVALFKARKDIPKHIRNAMGEITEAGYPTAKAMMELTSGIENAKFFNVVAKKWGKEISGEGLKQLPNTPRLANLASKYVPESIYDDIQEILRTSTGIGKKVVAGFKYGKVILNPATHARNILSNFILNSWEGLSPARIDIYGEAAKQLTTKGKWYKEAMEEGLGLNTFVAREIDNFLFDPQISKLQKGFKGNLSKISDLYQGEENFAKLAQFIFQRKKGLNPKDAWRIAEAATFDYSQVTPFIRKLRESLFGFPFITFTYKVTPRAVKTAIKAPTRISNIGKIKNAIENITGIEERKKERAVEPDYIRDGFYIRLPKKDKYGRPTYFDMTYILPFGDLISGQFFSAEGRATTPIQSALAKAPLLNVIKELSQNKDFFGNDIIRADSTEPNQIGGDIMKYLLKSYLPPLTEGPIETVFDKKVRDKLGVSGLLPGRMGRSIEFEKIVREDPERAKFRTTRTPLQEALRGYAGIKITPFRPEIERIKREKEMREKLEEYLKAKGLVKEFKTTFVPKFK